MPQNSQDQFPVNESAIEVEKFPDGEYSKSMNSVQYRPVSYLPSDSFLQLGLFAKEDIPKGSVIEGVAGFLAEIGDDEVLNGYNDVSILYSRMRNTQWMILGPVSFINAACKSNVEYRQKNKIVYCIATKDVSMDQELTVFFIIDTISVYSMLSVFALSKQNTVILFSIILNPLESGKNF